MIWKSCERFCIKPPNVKDCWNDCDVWIKAMLIGYEQVRSSEIQKEEIERLTNLAKALR